MKICPICSARLRAMVTDDPVVDNQLTEGYECPECGYDSVYDHDEPVDEPDDDEED